MSKNEFRHCLRPATCEDAEEIATIYLASRKKFLSYAPLAHSDEEVRSWIRDQLIPSDNVTVAEIEDQLVGMIATSTHDGISWIDQLYLDPEYIGQGIGTKLLQAALNFLTPPVRLYAYQQNVAAIRFYQGHGFRLIASSDGADNESKCPDVLLEFSES